MSYLLIYLDAGLSMTEKLSLSGEMLLRGMGTIFMVLAILWGFLSLFKVFSASEKPAKAPKQVAPAPKIDAKPVPAPAPAETPASVAPTPASAPSDDAAVIAAICAAIEAYRAEEGLSGLPYRVVSFTRKKSRKSWSGGNED